MKIPAFSVCLGLALAGHLFSKTIPDFAKADLVLGQPDFNTTSVAPIPTPSSLRNPGGIVIDPVTRKLFISDASNNRVLRYRNAADLVNGAPAEAVFGQPKFSSSGGAVNDQAVFRPTCLVFDRKGRLWVSDSGYNRVLMFEVASYRENYPHADKVIGQTDFTNFSPATAANRLANCYGICVDPADRLWVADHNNNRVLRFDSITTKLNGAPADAVLGQTGFTTQPPGTGATGLQNPIGIALSSSGALFVACDDAHRVMRFDNAAALDNGAPANAVLGQSDFSGTTAGLSATRFNTPMGLWITTDNTLWVGDYFNRRLLRFDKATTRPNGSAANGVIGQPDFLTKTDTTPDRTFIDPFAQHFVDVSGNLWVPSYTENRVLRFPPDTTKPTLAVTGNVPKTTTSQKVTIKGTASDLYGISKVQYKVGTGPVKTATGKTAWQFKASLLPGKNKITINSVDSVGNKSPGKVLNVTRN